MKRITFLPALITVLCLCTFQTVFANVFRINNTLVTDKTRKIYSSLQEAHDDGSNVGAGDTLLVEGTNIEYGTLTCTKRLVIIGTGYLLLQNGQNQANTLSSIVQIINFNTGSQGSIITGLLFSSRSTGYEPRISTDNIKIIRCYLTNGISITSSINNLAVIGNYLQNLSINSTGYSVGGLILRNNIITSNISIEDYSTAPRRFTAVEHNIFLGNVRLTTNSFRSNIIVNRTATVDVTSGGIQNNLFSNTQLPATNGNQMYDETALFVGLSGAANSPDGQYRLKTNSPYLTAGYNGAQPGIFGGNEPYVLSGIPAIPTIYDLQGDVIGSQQNGLNIIVKARTNN